MVIYQSSLRSVVMVPCSTELKAELNRNLRQQSYKYGSLEDTSGEKFLIFVINRELRTGVQPPSVTIICLSLICELYHH